MQLPQSGISLHPFPLIDEIRIDACLLEEIKALDRIQSIKLGVIENINLRPRWLCTAPSR
jgi:hypothetical protein